MGKVLLGNVLFYVYKFASLFTVIAENVIFRVLFGSGENILQSVSCQRWQTECLSVQQENCLLQIYCKHTYTTYLQLTRSLADNFPF